MRCPKCSFISFDLVEKCVKCGKDISSAGENLHGTTTSLEPPVFLRLEEPEPESTGMDQKMAAEGSLDLSNETFDMGSEEEVFLDFSAGESAAAMEEPPEPSAAGEEPAPGNEPEVDDFVFAPEPEADEPSMDIADLAPPEEKVEEEQAAAEEFAFMAEEQSAEAQMSAGHSLEDLRVEGIDLESSPAPAEKGKVMPSVKTGTALDDFDVDLGDLLSQKK